MARAAARASAAPAPAQRATRTRSRPIEEDVLLTAVLCLVAFGAVMVYSSSSAATVIKGGGDGTSFLVKYVIYGLIGFVVLHVISRAPLQRCRHSRARCWRSRSGCSCSSRSRASACR